MKRHLLIVLIIMCIFNTGCNKYDYRTDTPTGYYEYNTDELTQDEIAQLVNYDGSYTIAQENSLVHFSDTYQDSNIAIIAGEERTTKFVITLYVNSLCYFNNFQLTVDYLDQDNKLIQRVKSQPQAVLGGFYNSILIDKPENYDHFKIVSYTADNKGQIANVALYNFKEGGLIEQKSNTTYDVRQSNDFIVFLTEDNRVVYGCKGLQEGSLVVGRNYISKYAIVRGE